MPELPEVEIVRQNLETWWSGRAADRVVIHDEKLIGGAEPEAVVAQFQQPLREPVRRGKYLSGIFEDDSVAVFHFRMTGKIIRAEGPDPEYARMAWRVSPGEWLVFKDPRRLGQLDCCTPEEFDAYPAFEKMGPEPLDLSGEDYAELFSERRLVKSSMLDQQTVVGLGNIATSEVMWRVGLPPRAKGGDLDEQDWADFADAVRGWARDVLDAEAGEEVEYLAEGRDDNPFAVYGREGEPCPRCGATIDRVDVSGRSTYFCPNCQAK